MVFSDLNRNFLSGVKAGEGEPSDDYKANPEGSVSIIDVSKGVANVKQSDVRTAGFQQFNGTRLDPSIRIYGPEATVADSATFTRFVGLGFDDHSKPGNGFDASDRDRKVNL